MATTKLTIARTDVSTGLPYEALVKRFEETLGTWEAATAKRLIERSASWSDVEAAAGGVAGARGLMIIATIDQGLLTSLSGRIKKCRLYLVGNPVIAAGILDVDPHSALYVPFRVALFEGDNDEGARISFDRPSSSLAQLGNPQIDEVGALLDTKIDAVVAAVCSPT
ncbi:MAG: DUF302 domain-containing protein [Hyphomicrobium sp.]|jgi:uncharacterized protein (DUF302 family)